MQSLFYIFVPTLTFSTVSERKENERKYRRKDILLPFIVQLINVLR
jgi:predicted permease